ncbi:MAG: PAS domain S-box protein [Burkholderiales bacterium]
MAEDPVGNAVAVWEWDLRTGDVFLDHEPSAAVCWERCETGTVTFPWLARVHPDDRDRVQSALNEHLTGAAPAFRTTFRTPGPDGHHREILSRGRCRRDAAGFPMRVLGSHVDLSRLRVDPAAAPAGRSERLEPAAAIGISRPCSAGEESAACRWRQDKHLRFVEISGDTMRRWGIRPDVLLGRTIAEIRWTSGSVGDPACLAKVQRARGRFHDVVVGVPGDPGPVRWIALSGEPALDAHGGFEGYVGIGRDVTELERTRRELAEADERIRIAATHGRLGFWDWDVTTHRFRFSDGIADLLGLADTRSGIPAAGVFDRIHPLDRERLQGSAGSLAAAMLGDGFECRIVSPAGATRWVHLQGLRTVTDARGVARRQGILRDITRRKEAEIALQACEERFRVLLEVSSDYYWEQDAQFRFTEIRRGGFADVPDREAGDLGKRPWEDSGIEPPVEGWEARRSFLEQHLPFRDVPRRRRLPGGEERTLVLSGFPAFDADGRFVGYRGVSQDVTERERIHRRTLESEARFRALTELSVDWYWEQDADLRYTFISEGYDRLMKLPAGARLGMRRWDIDRDLVPEAVWAGHMRLLVAHEPFIDFVITRRDGEGALRSHSVSGTPVFDESGRFGGYRGVSRDITDAKRAEDALRQSEQRFRMLAEGTRDVVWISDPAMRRIEYVNPAVEAVWGIAPEALVRDPSLWKSVVHPEDRPLAEEALHRQGQGEAIDVEFRIRRGEGDVRWLWVRSKPTQDEHGGPIVCGITEDITNRKRAQLRNLEEAVRQRDALVREVHHRIKNNLQGVAGLLRSHAHRDRHAATALESAIAQIQAIATVHGLQGAEDGSGVDVIRVVEAIAQMLETLTSVRIDIAGDDGVGPRLQLAEDEAVVTALILNELIVNAVKHGAVHGPAGGVRVRVQSMTDSVEVDVRNRGTLLPGFDLDRRSGLGTGLKLVCALMPKVGLSLDLRTDGDDVVATVRASAPVVRVVPMQALESH